MAAQRRRPRSCLAVESLENRCLLDGIPIIPNLPSKFLSASTVPANGDLNPYGVAFVPRGFPEGGPLHPGDILVSNFNNNVAGGNLQGRGTTIVDLSPTGKQTLFFQGSSTPGDLGLTTALGVLSRGFVLVGSLPTIDGMSSSIQKPGALLILNSQGKTVMTLRDSKFLDGPWDLTVNDEGDEAQVFVSNVLSGTVTRLDLSIPEHGNPMVTGKVQIASGYTKRTDPTALVLGPTGLAYDADREILYVASTADNAIYAIDNAEDRTTDAKKGTKIYSDSKHLNGPLALTLTPNGDLITSNGDAFNPNSTVPPSELIEFTPKGHFVAELQVDTVPGSAFGLALETAHDQIHFAAVDDNSNTLDIWTMNVDADPDGRSTAPSRPAIPELPSNDLIGASPNANRLVVGEAASTMMMVPANTAALEQLFAETATTLPRSSLTSQTLPVSIETEIGNQDVSGPAL
ncbi:MAG TPA: hypothetical protein VKU02_14465 [Gemmataceae bacterium]|nr:hypothetical protein [Gemmataceae bacterium]